MRPCETKAARQLPQKEERPPQKKEKAKKEEDVRDKKGKDVEKTKKKRRKLRESSPVVDREEEPRRKPPPGGGGGFGGGPAEGTKLLNSTMWESVLRATFLSHELDAAQRGSMAVPAGSALQGRRSRRLYHRRFSFLLPRHRAACTSTAAPFHQEAWTSEKEKKRAVRSRRALYVYVCTSAPG